MNSLPLTVAASVLGCLLASSPALAQPPPTAQDGQRLLDAGQPNEALATLARVEAALGPAGDRKALAALHLVRGSVYWNRAALDDCDREARTAEQLAKGLD